MLSRRSACSVVALLLVTVAVLWFWTRDNEPHAHWRGNSSTAESGPSEAGSLAPPGVYSHPDPVTSTGSIRGRLRQAGAGAPPRARVFCRTADSDEWMEGTPDSNGEFGFDNLKAGRFEVVAAAAPDGNIRSVKECAVEIGRRTWLEFDLEAGTLLEGRVTDSSGQPIVGAHISYLDLNRPGPRGDHDPRWTGVLTDAGGQYSFSDLRMLNERGKRVRYTVQAACAGYTRAVDTVVVASGRNTLDFILEASVVTEVRGVVLLPDGTPGAKAKVWIRWHFAGDEEGNGARFGLAEAMADDRGSFETSITRSFPPLEPDDGIVARVELPGWPITYVRLELQEGRRNLRVELRVRERAVISGTVVAESGDLPAQLGIMIHEIGTPGSEGSGCSADLKGRFEYGTAAKGARYKISCQMDGWEPVLMEVVAPSQNVEIRLRKQR